MQIKGPIHNKKNVNILKQKIGVNILAIFLTVCGVIDGSILFDIFWRVANIVTTGQYFVAWVGSCQNFDYAKIQSSGEQLLS